MKIRLWVLAMVLLALTVLSGPSWAAQPWDDPTAATRSRSVAHYIMGVNYDLMGMESAALGEYEQSAKSDIASFAPRLRLGVAYARGGNYHGAVRELLRAVTIDPQDMQAHYYLALVYSNLREYDKAAEQYEVILKKLSLEEPKNAELFTYLGQLYHSQGKPDKAVEQFEKVLKIDPKNTGAMGMIALYDLDHGKRQEATDLLKKCILQNPLDDACLNSLSYTYAEDNVNVDEAEKLVRRALEIDPKNPAYMDTLGWIYYRRALYEDALKELARAEALIKDPTIYSHIAEVYLKLDRQDMAKKYWQFSLQVDPEQPAIRSKLGSLGREQTSSQKKQD